MYATYQSQNSVISKTSLQIRAWQPVYAPTTTYDIIKTLYNYPNVTKDQNIVKLRLCSKNEMSLSYSSVKNL